MLKLGETRPGIKEEKEKRERENIDLIELSKIKYFRNDLPIQKQGMKTLILSYFFNQKRVFFKSNCFCLLFLLKVSNSKFRGNSLTT